VTFTVRIDLTRLPWEEGGERLVKEVLAMLDEAAAHGWSLQIYASIGVAQVLPELLRTCADHGHDVDLFPLPGDDWETASAVWRKLGLALHGAAREIEGAEFVAMAEETVELALPICDAERTEIARRLQMARMRTHRQRWKDARS